MRLHPCLPPLWRGDGELQLGLDPRLALVLTDLSREEQRFVESLARPVPRSRTRRSDLVELARRHRVGATRAEAIVEHLRTHGALEQRGDARGAVEPPSRTVDLPGATSGDEEQPAAADAVGLLTGSDVRAVRAAADVVVIGGAGPGLAVGLLLASAGIGGVAVVDEALVGPTDVAAGGYRPDQVGQPRGTAAVAALRARVPRLRTRVARPDVAVLVEPHVAVPFRSSALVREDVTHLSVVARQLDVVVGPLVRPGRGACLRCLDLHRCDADPAWPSIATQLATVPWPQHEEATWAAATGLAASAVLAVVDGRGETLEGTSLAVGGGSAAATAWTPHPECGCGAGPMGR
ncbi:hypothetical protein FH969_04880 [Miniimonas arenae]|uniref:THIF-type NAD/FAD binding fold domain-containing protein n=1 Tax=Miniimonas arenae TaxID=676201 RepID=A0A5C5BFG3_9MICO|nr:MULTISPECIES: ThiF family adenylyltransferase [Miniimonas]TNU75997.1 hypothetical protein FH969_04880 [Miniimonas arenae]